MSVIDLLHDNCGENPIIPGVKTEVAVVCKKDIVTYPAMSTGTNPGDSLRTTGDFELDAGKKWAILEIITDKGKIEEEQIGNEGSRHMKSMFNGFVVHAGAETMEWFEKMANGCAIAVIHEKTGDKRILGGEDSPIKQTSFKAEGGDELGSNKEVTFTWESTTGRPALYYDGVIDLTV